MALDSEKVNLLKIKTEQPGVDVRVKCEKNKEKLVEDQIRVATVATVEESGTEERQRTGRYLAIGATLVMLFIAFYNTLLRHVTVLAGLLAPAIIMCLYVLWLFYFAKKKKTQVAAV